MVGTKGSKEVCDRGVVGKMMDPRRRSFAEREVDQSQSTDDLDEPFAGDPHGLSIDGGLATEVPMHGSMRGARVLRDGPYGDVLESVLGELLERSTEDAFPGCVLTVYGHTLGGMLMAFAQRDIDERRPVVRCDRRPNPAR